MLLVKICTYSSGQDAKSPDFKTPIKETEVHVDNLESLDESNIEEKDQLDLVHDTCFEDYLKQAHPNLNTIFDEIGGVKMSRDKFLLTISPLLRKGYKLIDIAILMDTPTDSFESRFNETMAQIESILDTYPD